MQPGHGWVAASIQAASDTPLSAIVEAGGKISPNWAAYGDAWVKPLSKTAGADVGVQYKNNIDLFAGGWADLDGHAGGQVGMKYNW